MMHTYPLATISPEAMAFWGVVLAAFFGLLGAFIQKRVSSPTDRENSAVNFSAGLMTDNQAHRKEVRELERENRALATKLMYHDGREQAHRALQRRYKRLLMAALRQGTLSPEVIELLAEGVDDYAINDTPSGPGS